MSAGFEFGNFLRRSPHMKQDLERVFALLRVLASSLRLRSGLKKEPLQWVCKGVESSCVIFFCAIPWAQKCPPVGAIGRGGSSQILLHFPKSNFTIHRQCAACSPYRRVFLRLCANFARCDCVCFLAAFNFSRAKRFCAEFCVVAFAKAHLQVREQGRIANLEARL